MNRFTIKVSGVPGDAIRLKSTLDRSYSLAAGGTAEDVTTGPDDVLVIKNAHESEIATLTLKGLAMKSGRLIFRPSRQQSFVLHEGRELLCDLAPGESCVVRAEGARDPVGTPDAGVTAV